MIVTDLSPLGTVSIPGMFHMGFLVDKVEVAQVLLLVLRLLAVTVIPPMLHTAYNHRLCCVTLATGSVVKLNTSNFLMSYEFRSVLYKVLK